MARTVILTVATIPGVSYAPGTVLAGYNVGLQVSSGAIPPTVQSVVDLSQPIRFEGVESGEYMAGVTRLDAAGNPVGAPSTVGPFTVSDAEVPPVVVGDGPGSITVSFE